MSQLGSRTTADTANTHVSDHNELHRLHNQLDDDAATDGDLIHLVSGDWVTDTAAGIGLSEVGHTHPGAGDDYLPLTGGTVTGDLAVEGEFTPQSNINMDQSYLYNLPNAVNPGDAVSKAYAEAWFLLKSGGQLNGDLDMDGHGIQNLQPGVNPSDAATVSQLGGGGGGGDGLAVFNINANTVLTASGVYIVSTSGGNRTITLPVLSSTPATGYRIQILREGSGYVYVVPNAADDFWDGNTQRTIYDDYGGISVVAGSASASWLELGRYRTVT